MSAYHSHLNAVSGGLVRGMLAGDVFGAYDVAETGRYVQYPGRRVEVNAEVRAIDARQRAAREAATGSAWMIKASLSEDNLRTAAPPPVAAGRVAETRRVVRELQPKKPKRVCTGCSKWLRGAIREMCRRCEKAATPAVLCETGCGRRLSLKNPSGSCWACRGTAKRRAEAALTARHCACGTKIRRMDRTQCGACVEMASKCNGCGGAVSIRSRTGLCRSCRPGNRSPGHGDRLRELCAGGCGRIIRAGHQQREDKLCKHCGRADDSRKRVRKLRIGNKCGYCGVLIAPLAKHCRTHAAGFRRPSVRDPKVWAAMPKCDCGRTLRNRTGRNTCSLCESAIRRRANAKVQREGGRS